MITKQTILNELERLKQPHLLVINLGEDDKIKNYLSNHQIKYQFKNCNSILSIVNEIDIYNGKNFDDLYEMMFIGNTLDLINLEKLDQIYSDINIHLPIDVPNRRISMSKIVDFIFQIEQIDIYSKLNYSKEFTDTIQSINEKNIKQFKLNLDIYSIENKKKDIDYFLEENFSFDISEQNTSQILFLNALRKDFSKAIEYMLIKEPNNPYKKWLEQFIEKEEHQFYLQFPQKSALALILSKDNKIEIDTFFNHNFTKKKLIKNSILHNSINSNFILLEKNILLSELKKTKTTVESNHKKIKI